MMRSFSAKVTGSVVGACLFLAPLMLHAEPYVIDQAHARVGFAVNHLGFSTVRGQFHKFDGEIDFNPDDVESSKISFEIEADSIDTNWPERDAHLRTSDFFDVENHPSITFVSTKIVSTGDNTADVTGNLTLLGVTKEATFHATLNKIGPFPLDPEKQVAGFGITGSIDRTAFGMDFASPGVSNEVEITVDLEMSPAS